MKSSNNLRWSEVELNAFANEFTQNQFSSRSAGRVSRMLGKIAACVGGTALTLSLCNKAVMWVSGLLLATFLSTMARGQQASLPPRIVRLDSQVAAVAEIYRNAVLKEDISALMRLYRDDAVEMTFFRPAVDGRGAIQQFYEEQFQSPLHVTSFTFLPIERSVHGDLAYDVGSYTRIMNTLGGSTKGTGSYVVLLRRTAGQWKIAYISYTCNSAPGSEGVLTDKQQPHGSK